MFQLGDLQDFIGIYPKWRPMSPPALDLVFCDFTSDGIFVPKHNTCGIVHEINSQTPQIWLSSFMAAAL